MGGDVKKFAFDQTASNFQFEFPAPNFQLLATPNKKKLKEFCVNLKKFQKRVLTDKDSKYYQITFTFDFHFDSVVKLFII